MKRSLSLLLVAVLMLSLFAGCGKKDDSLFEAGTYTGEGTGFGGAITVEVVVDADKIISVTPKEHSETAGISDGAFEKIPAAIVANQSLAVDTVAGCTMSSNGLIEAATAALSKATKDMDKLLAGGSTATPGEDVEKSADVVVIGAGGAGMNAAVEALKAGSSVIIIEKMPAAGGNTIRAGSAYNSVDPDRQESETMSETEMEAIKTILETPAHDDHMAGWQATLAAEIAAYEAAGSTYLFDSPALHKLQTYIGGDYVADPAKIEILCDNALDGLNYLGSVGTVWTDAINAAVGATWRRSHTPTRSFGGSGADFVLPQVAYAEQNGAEFLYEYTATEFVVTDGRVTGVKGTTNDGGSFTVSANKAVVLATGGFGANVEMRQAYNKHWANLDETILTNNHPGATGDGIVMAEAIGAATEGLEWIQMIPTYGPGLITPYIENQFYINKEGSRFIAEDGRRDVLAGAILEQTDSQCYILSDANTMQGSALELSVSRNGNGYHFYAETLEELAEMIDIPLETLQAAIDQFNEARATGNDPLGRKVFDQEFGTAPFSAGLTGPQVHHTMGGVTINTDAQVLDAEGNVIPGLYAAGEVTGGIHGSNRLGGNAIADITVFGRIAGQNAAAEPAA